MYVIEVPLVKYGVLIPKINALSSFALFDEDRCNLTTCTLPFIKNYQLLVAQTFTTIPVVTMHYLWNTDNNDMIKLDGTREALFNNLGKFQFLLIPSTVVPYVAFVLGHVQNEQGSLRLTECICSIEFSNPPTFSEMEFLKETIKPATVVEEAEGFYITCYVIYGDTLFEANIRVEQNGEFEFLEEKQMGEPMPCLLQIFIE